MNKGEQQGPPLWWPRQVLYPRTWPTRAHCGAFQILKEKFPRPDAAGTVSSGTPRAMRHSYGRHHAAIQRGFPRCCKKRACPNPTGREVRAPLQSGAGGPEAQCCGGVAETGGGTSTPVSFSFCKNHLKQPRAAHVWA